MAQPKLKLYVDIVSPYAYLAFHVIRVRGSLDNLISPSRPQLFMHDNSFRPFDVLASLNVSAS